MFPVVKLLNVESPAFKLATVAFPETRLPALNEVAFTTALEITAFAMVANVV